MERHNVEQIFDENKKKILKINGIESSQNPTAVILGGQPASGKSSLAKLVQAEHPEKKFFVVNGDNFREYHPQHNQLINNDIENYSRQTQIFSNVFTEGFIKEALENKYNVIIEGTMRNPATPLNTAEQFKAAGFKVEAYAIITPSIITELSVFNRYSEEVEKKGSGRLSDLSAHNEAVKGLPKSLDALYESGVVDKISLHTFQSRSKVQDFTNEGGKWDTSVKPSVYVGRAIEEQLKDKPFLLDAEQRGMRTLEKLNPELKEPLKNSLERLHSHINNIDLKEAALKNDFDKILQLKEQGVKLTPSGLKDLEVSGVSSPTLIALQKVFNLPVNTPRLESINLVKGSPTTGTDKNNDLSI